MKKFFGWFLLLGLFGGVFTLMAIQAGLLEALLGWSIAVAFVGLTGLAINLILGDS